MIRQILMLVFGLCISITADDFRILKDHSGQTIEAKVLGLDLKTKRVELEMRNGKTGRIPFSQLQLTEDDKIFFNGLKTGAVFSSPDFLKIKITEETEPHFDESTRKKGKKHIYTIAIGNKSNSDFDTVFLEYCIYRNLGSNKHRSTNLELPQQRLLAGETVSPKTTQRHATFTTSGKMSISGLRVRLYYKMPNGTYAIREQCYPKKLPLEQYAWARSDRAREEERANAPSPANYPERMMTERDIRDLANRYAQVWRDNDFDTWSELLYPMHVGRAELEPGWFDRTAKTIKFLKIAAVSGRNVKMRVTYEKKDETEGWLQISPSGHIKYTPVIFEHPFKRACSSLAMMGSPFPHLREPSMENLEEMNVPVGSFNPNSKNNDAAINKIHHWLAEERSRFDVSEPRIALPEKDALAALEKARNMMKAFKAMQ